jgi:hypothetical protein
MPNIIAILSVVAQIKNADDRRDVSVTLHLAHLMQREAYVIKVKNNSGHNICLKIIGSVQYLRFEVFGSVTLKITIFWDVTPCSLVEVTDASEERAASIFRIGK